jgi:hypothetical protein
MTMKLAWPIGSPARIREFNECFKELVALVESSEWQHEELRAFGAPSECYQQVHLGLSREAMKILKKWGFTGFEHFAEEANQRGYGKLAYVSGIFMFA